MVGHYRRKSLNWPKPGQPRPSCILCRQFLKPERRNIGVCLECEKLANDPEHFKIALRYFNDPKYLARLMIAQELLKGDR